LVLQDTIARQPAPELSSEAFSDQENASDGNVARGMVAELLPSAAKAMQVAPSGEAAWQALCSEVLSAADVLAVSRHTRCDGK
jgi:hypothetical protein